VKRAIPGLLALLLMLTGCGKEQTPQETATTSPGQPAATTPAPGGTEAAKPATEAAAPLLAQDKLDGVTKAKKPYKIVLIVKTRNNPFFTPMINAFEQTAKELGVQGDVQTPPQETDSEKQFDLVKTEVSKGVDAICIAPADSKGIVPALKAAQEKGILVINIDNQVDKAASKEQGLSLGGYVGADNQTGGRLAGAAMLATLGRQADVAIIEGIRGTDNAEARKNGFTSAVTGKLTIVAAEPANWNRDQAYQKTLNLLAKYPHLAGIFCANDVMATGALKAIAEAGKKGKVVVVGYDNIPDVKGALASGDLAATIEQHPDLMGKYGLKMAVGLLDGNPDIPKGGQFLVPLDTIKK
jgi:ribose transport system substrate-binding protein